LTAQFYAKICGICQLNWHKGNIGALLQQTPFPFDGHPSGLDCDPVIQVYQGWRGGKPEAYALR
jgi:hypothetical protein